MSLTRNLMDRLEMMTMTSLRLSVDVTESALIVFPQGLYQLQVRYTAVGEECEDEIEALAVKVRFAGPLHDATVLSASTVINQ